LEPSHLQLKDRGKLKKCVAILVAGPSGYMFTSNKQSGKTERKKEIKK
jgi:hypothetical protein